MTTTAMDTEQKELPAGWKWVKLGEVCGFVNGKTFRQSDWKATGYPIIRIQNLNNPDAEFNNWDGSLEKQVVINTGDLLLAWSGTPGTSFGAHLWKGEIGVLNQHIFKVSVDDRYIQKQFALRAINFHLTTLIDAAQGAVGLRHVTKGEVENLFIPLPPLGEQKRIAAILNEQMATVEKAKKAAEERLEAAKALPAAYLREVFPSSEDELPAGWKWVKLGDVLTLNNGRAYKRSEWEMEGTPVIRIQNLNGGDDWFYSNKNLPDHQYCFRDDLLFAWSASFGPYLWDGGKAIYHYHIWRIDPSPHIDKIYAFYLLNQMTTDIKAGSHGMAMLHMTKGAMEKWDIPLPPLEEQNRVVAELNDRISAVSVAEESIQQELDTIEAMPASLLRKAFRGEL